MKKVFIAVCDTNGAYGEKLAEWVSLENEGSLQGISFSAPECFLEYFNTQKLDIVLLANGFLESAQMQEFLQMKYNGKSCFSESSREGTLWVYLHEEGGEAEIPLAAQKFPIVEKYQPASAILREVFSHYQKWNSWNEPKYSIRKEVLGVYSPGHSIWQTPFALTFAHVLGQREKVLYVNFNECAGFRGWFQEEYEKDLLDVMYLCLSNEVNVSHCVKSALYHMNGIHYIPPAEDGGCLGEISPEDYVKFVQLLAAKSSYDIIILDFGMMIPGFFKLLGECSHVYIPTEQGELQEGPLQQFQRMAKRQADTQLDQKLNFLSLPVVGMCDCLATCRLEQWLWGALGDFCRGIAGVQSGTD